MQRKAGGMAGVSLGRSACWKHGHHRATSEVSMKARHDKPNLPQRDGETLFASGTRA